MECRCHATVCNRYCMVGSALWIIKPATLRGRDFIIHNARAYHATSDIYPDPDWSVVVANDGRNVNKTYSVLAKKIKYHPTATAETIGL